MSHSTMARVKAGAKDSFAVLACVTAREDLLSDALRGLSIEALAERTLNIITRPFGLLQSRRDSEGHVEDFLCVWINDSARKLLNYDSDLGNTFRSHKYFQTPRLRAPFLTQHAMCAKQAGPGTLK